MTAIYTSLSYSQLADIIRNVSRNTSVRESLVAPEGEDSTENNMIRAGLAINTYWLPIIIPLGLVGNILSLSVMLQRQNRKTTCAIYFSALAVCDCVVLLWGLYLWSILTFNIHMSWASCAIPTYSLLSATQSGTLILIATTCDRFVAVKWPLKSSSYFTTRRAKYSLITICVFSHVFNIPHVFITELVDQKTCASFAVDHYLVSLYSWLSIIVNALLPFSLLLVMNTGIIVLIRDRMDYFHGMTQNGRSTSGVLSESRMSLRDTGQQQTKNDNQLTVMLLCVTFVFIILTMPQYTRYVVYTFIPIDSDPATFATFVLIYHITNKAFYTNSAVNFWLYVASGSKFRQDLKRLCFGGNRRMRRKASTTTLSTRIGVTTVPTQEIIPMVER